MVAPLLKKSLLLVSHSQAGSDGPPLQLLGEAGDGVMGLTNAYLS